MTNQPLFSAAFAFVALLAACSSEADPGEACEEPGGMEDVCADGTVCGRPSGKAVSFACIPICVDDDQCPAGHECNGVEGTSVKGCRFKD